MKVEQYENAALYCGDCREVFHDLPTVPAVITDPPYGILYETRRRKFMERPGAIENDEAAPLWCVPLIAGKVEDGGAVYICTQFPVMAAWQEVMIRAGLKLKTTLVWDKKHHTAGDLTGDHGNRAELILFGHKGRHTLRNGRQGNLWSISHQPAGEHPTPKPVELMSQCIVNSTDPRARELADRHYNRQKPGTPQLAPPGRALVLYAETETGRAFWVTSYPFAQYVRHAWVGAWICSAFRNEGAGIASEMIRDVATATRAYLGGPPTLGLVTFIDRRKVCPAMVHGAKTWGYTYRLAGFREAGETKGGLPPSSSCPRICCRRVWQRNRGFRPLEIKSQYLRGIACNLDY